MANVIEVVLRAKDQMSSKLKTAEGGVSNFTKGLMAIGGAAAGIYAVNRAMNSLIALAADQERAEFTLAAAMKQAGTYTEEAYQHNLDYAASLQKITAYGDEQIMVAQKMLTNFGIEGRMLDDLTKATLDLAAAKGFDLKSAADLVAKSVGSSTNALTRYGITIEGVVGSMERQQMAVENITALFGGAAAAEAKTYHGQIKSMKDATGDLGESLGSVLIPAIKEMTELITDLSSELNGLLPSLEDNQAAWDDWVKPMLEIVSGLRDVKELTADIQNLTSGKMSIAEMIFGDPGTLENILLKIGIAEDTVKRIVSTMQRAQSETDYGYTGPSITDIAPGRWGPTRGTLPSGEVPGAATGEPTPYELIGPSLDDIGQQFSGRLPGLIDIFSQSMYGVAEATQTASGEIIHLGDDLETAGGVGFVAAMTIGSAFSAVFSGITQEGFRMKDALSSMFSSLASSAMSLLSQIALIGVGGMTGGSIGGLLGLLPFFAGGGIVPSSGIPGPRGGIMIEAHPGERVTPPGQGASVVNNYYESYNLLDMKSSRHYFRRGAGGRELRKAGFR